jgi:hypothetical protein
VDFLPLLLVLVMSCWRDCSIQVAHSYHPTHAKKINFRT